MCAQFRRESEAGMYHAISRGVDHCAIFVDRKDRTRFLELLESVSSECEVVIDAWCLMGNHYHLLVSCGIGALSAMMMKLNAAYAKYFNARHERDGHLFQGRFKSVPIESDEQYLTVVRYIHQNPEKAGICLTAEYPWSSYQEYMRGGGIASTKQALSMLGGVRQFELFHRTLEQDDTAPCFLDGREWPSEEAMMDSARAVLRGGDPRGIRKLTPQERNNAILALKQSRFTTRQIERLTGISRSTISRIK